MELALNNLQMLIYHKTEPTNQPKLVALVTVEKNTLLL